MSEKVKVRFAPSPTGTLHVGSARTALFNYLFARSQKGKYILRIEDTDFDRSADEYVMDIVKGLSWLKIKPDEKIYYQSQRRDLYLPYIEKILKSNSAYHCYCTDEELESERAAQIAAKKPPRYLGKCRSLSPHQIEEFKKQGRKPAIRFAMPQENILIEDLVHGLVKFDASLIGDFIIVKSNGMPSYNFAAVIDDHLMGITHIIRGEDHLSNTPKQMALYKVLGLKLPKFAHISMILGPDRSKLSKRHGAKSILEYKAEGYLPEAITNYLSLLSWTPKKGEVLSFEDSLKEFKLEDVSKSPAVFDAGKLDWMNGQYIRSVNKEYLLELSLPFLAEAGFDIEEKEDEWLVEVIESVKDNLVTLRDLKNYVGVFFEEDINYEKVKEALFHPYAILVIQGLIKKIPSLKEITHDSVLQILNMIVEENKLKKGEVFKTVRILLTGRNSGPELWRIIKIFGLEKCLKRIRQALEMRK